MPGAYRLRICGMGGSPDVLFPLGDRSVVVGRDWTCDLCIDTPSVSRRHGRFDPGTGGYLYTDLGSSNGSALVRGEERAKPLGPNMAVELSPGDVLLLGSANAPARLRVEDSCLTADPIIRTLTTLNLPPEHPIPSPDAFATLAAHALHAREPADLAAAADAWLGTLLPEADRHAVRIVGSGFSVDAGSPLPPELAAIAMQCPEGVRMVEADAADPALPGEVRPAFAVVVPLLSDGGWHGFMAVWSHARRDAIPDAVVGRLAVGASLLALSATAMATRIEREQTARSLEREVAALKAAMPVVESEVEPIGISPGFVDAVDLCRRIAPTDVSVLFVGETGTGKEVLARAIHRWSRRADRPFVAFHCAAVPEPMRESVLFGYVQGAFPGATADRTGLFEAASGGTLLLDEIGEMPATLQARLLRVFEDGEIRRLGANWTTRVDVRVLSATTIDLGRQIETGRFHSDLLYRLNAVTVRLPPLRERREDIPVLAHHFLGLACRRMQKHVPGFSPDALNALCLHAFPGNVRELENAVLRAAALTPEGLPVPRSAFSLPGLDADRTPLQPFSLQEIVEAAERETITATLERTGGNVSQAARELGLTRPGLYKVLARLGLRSVLRDEV